MADTLAIAKEYINLVLKKPLSEVGELLSDTVGYWRLKNKVNLMLKAKAWLEEKGVAPSAISPDILMPILEEGSITEEEHLSNMFSSLLASHLDEAMKSSVHPSFSKVLSQLSALDASVLAVYGKYKSHKEARDIGLRGGSFTVDYIAEEASGDVKGTYLSSLNLSRLGLIEHKGYETPEGHRIPSMFEDSPECQVYRVTEYGLVFLEACNYGET